jgi:DNA-binding response OmpR family regulator
MKKVLVVDDDRMFRTTMKRHLNQLGFEVIENDSGLGVIKQIQQDHPVVCLIDIIMDQQEGLQTILEIVSLANRPKIIAVSSSLQYLDWAIEMGADTTLVKPISPDKLANTLNNLFD